MARDLGAEGVERFHLYNASNHAALPWTGVLSGFDDPAFLLLGNQPVHCATGPLRDHR